MGARVVGLNEDSFGGKKTETASMSVSCGSWGPILR